MKQIKNKTNILLPKILLGSVHQQFKKCGKSNCKCSRGELHGAYYYHFVRVNGKLRKRYLKAGEVEYIQTACAARQNTEKQQRANTQADWEQLRELRSEIREFKNHFNK